jgi:hypothetical protein
VGGIWGFVSGYSSATVAEFHGIPCANNIFSCMTAEKLGGPYLPILNLQEDLSGVISNKYF